MVRCTQADISRTAGSLLESVSGLAYWKQKGRPYICPVRQLIALVPPHATVLDVGCGSGLFLGLLAVEGKVSAGVGFDSDPAAIATARRMLMSPLLRGAQARLSFQLRTASDPWPQGTFQVVSMIDVLHHVPLGLQRDFFGMAVSRVAPGGVLIYKDMCRSPRWRAWANRLHDLLLAKQWISCVPIDEVAGWAARDGLALEHQADIVCSLIYGHELRVFRRVR